MATKQESRREDYDEALRELKEEFEERLSEMEGRLSKSLNTERRTMGKEQETMKELKRRFGAVGDRMSDGIDRADDMVKDHPVLVVGGALAVGMALGALLIGRSRD